MAMTLAVDPPAPAAPRPLTQSPGSDAKTPAAKGSTAEAAAKASSKPVKHSPSQAPIVSLPGGPPPGVYAYGPPPPHLYHYPGPPPPHGPPGKMPGPMYVYDGRGPPPPPPGYYPGPPGYPPYPGAPMLFHPPPPPTSSARGPPPPPPGMAITPGARTEGATESKEKGSAPWHAAEEGERSTPKEEKEADQGEAREESNEGEEEKKDGEAEKEAPEDSPNPAEEKGEGAAPQPVGTVTKPKADKAEEDGTPATANETLSQISPQGSGGGIHPQGSAGPPTVHHVYRTHQKPPMTGGSSPPFSHGSFSRITGPPSAAWYASGPPPPPGSAVRVPGMPPLPQGSPYVYQYQHFDPRSHVEGPPPRPGYYAAGAVPPTVHLPNHAPIVKDISPLPHFSAIKIHHGRRPPATPEDKKTTDGKGQGSPLDLLSSVSEGKGTTTQRAVPHAVPSHVGSHYYPHPAYSYPPPPPGGPGYAPAPHHAKRPPAIDTRSPPVDDDAVAPAPPKSATSLDQILSAANTLDGEDGATNGGKKRKLRDDEAREVRKRLHKKAPAAEHLFAVGGYPPGFDPNTLPPSRASLKPTPKNMKGYLDETTLSQAEKARRLAEQALEHPRVGKKLLLSMALVRTNPRTPPSCYPSHGTVLTDRFHWAAFPPLDSILRKHMRQYYELSTHKCQSRDQQEFNNMLVTKVIEEAQRYGWEFDAKAFDDKKIRDRVRCFYKTHIQNAKKRLKTMLRNPEKRANIKALAAHYHIIEEKGVDREEEGGYGREDESDDDDDGFGLGRSYGHDGYGGASRGEYGTDVQGV